MNDAKFPKGKYIFERFKDNNITISKYYDRKFVIEKNIKINENGETNSKKIPNCVKGNFKHIINILQEVW